jgi:hypothetical protein
LRKIGQVSNKNSSRKRLGLNFKKFKKIKWIPTSLVDVVIKFFNSIKNFFVYRSYWGRGSTYKQAVHVSIFVITLVVAFSGVSYRIFGLNQSSSQSLSTNYFGSVGNVDLLQQGGSVQSLFATNSTTPFDVNYYKVVEGDTLQAVADKFQVTKETIKWSNTDKFSNYERYTNEGIAPGEVLIIPQVSGVLYQVKEGDNLDSILQKTSGDRFTTIEINQLANSSIQGRQLILVPDGKLPAPQPPAPVFTYTVSFRPRPSPGDCSANGEFNGVALSNPLCHPECAGYTFSRGLIYGDNGYLYHDGVDLAKGGGCPVSAMCDGIVTRTGWENGGGGYVVRIDCGNGVNTLYYHGDGNIWVSAGQSVSRGDPVMYMGNSGNSSGTHLHFILRQGGITVDPAQYVGY